MVVVLGMTRKNNAPPAGGKLKDKFQRTISYLRLSITDKCNLRCLYCMPCTQPSENVGSKILPSIDADELLSYEELLRIVSVSAAMGMSKIRLTGGEPLLRRGVMGFIEKLVKINGIEQIRMTTNGVLLDKHGSDLYELGVRHLNISLDTLDKEKFLRVTGRDLLREVIRGIDSAKELGFKIKLNVVAMNGINHDEFVDFANFALQHDIQVRFIEFMPIGKGSLWKKEHYITSEAIKEIILGSFDLQPIAGRSTEGPARLFTVTNGVGKEGRIGFISPISHHFCDSCNRLRLTSEGKLRACLLHDRDTDLKAMLRSGCSDEDIERAIRETIIIKPKGHELNSGQEEEGQPACRVNMSRIGG